MLNIRTIACVAIVVSSMCAGALQAKTPGEKGKEIIEKMDFHDTGFGDQTNSVTMTLRNVTGKESIRKMRTLVLEGIGDGDKNITVFDQPRDVKNTAVLTYSHAIQSNEQWIYIPSLKRTKRISSKNKSGAFMGSEFAFEDIGAQEVDKFHYRYLGEEEIDGKRMYVIEYYPRYSHSGYTRLINWIDAERYYQVKTEFYDRKNSLLKTLIQSDYKQYLNKFWRAHTMTMTNYQNKKSTVMSFHDIEFEQGLTENQFTSVSLSRIR